MKLSIRNLGKMASAELDIRPLTVFVGPNNTNKTWTAYALYGLARDLSYVSFCEPPIKKAVLSQGSALKTQIADLAERIQKSLLNDPQAI